MIYTPPTLILNTYQTSMSILCHPHQTFIFMCKAQFLVLFLVGLCYKLTLATIGMHVIYDQMWCLWYLQKCVVKAFVEMHV